MPVFEQALAVLSAGGMQAKPGAAHDLARNWAKAQNIGPPCAGLPDSPARPAAPLMIPPGETPRRRLGSEAGRCALLHAVAHIEFNAIDLAADMICRFGPSPLLPDNRRAEFITDWVKVLDDEARHFGLLNTRLSEMNMTYGDLPAHNGLWEAALATRHDMTARLAIAPLVLEARGLDVTPPMIAKFEKFGDSRSAEILKIIYEDEIGHVATGAKWFHILAEICQKDPETHFGDLVKQYFKGSLKPPFNYEARGKAGLPRSYYASAV